MQKKRKIELMLQEIRNRGGLVHGGTVLWSRDRPLASAARRLGLAGQ